MRPLGLCAISVAVAATSPAAALTPYVAQIRVEGGASLETLAWRDGDNVFVDQATLASLGLTALTNATAPYRLQDISGARVRIDEAESAITILCAASCFSPQALRAASDTDVQSLVTPGGFANVDLAWRSGESLTGLLDLGRFDARGLAEASFIAGAHPLRLDTSWTMDNVGERRRFVLGDAISRSGATGLPIRFGGVSFGTDFSLTPDFVAFPTPSLRGESAVPAVLDLYVDNVLAFRAQAEAGPFSIEDAPIPAGAGVARIVVRDVLGRETTISQPFYASPDLLRPGLSDFAFALGAERRNYGVRGNDYGQAFVSGLLRRGVTSSLTAEARGEVRAHGAMAGLAATMATTSVGQIDVAAATSAQDGRAGNFVSLGWTRVGSTFSAAGVVEAASENFSRLGEAAAPRLSARLGASWTFARVGDLSLAATAQDEWRDSDVQTLALGYAPRLSGPLALAFGLTWARAEESSALFAVTLAAPLGDSSISSAVSAQAGDVRARLEAQRAPPRGGGVGYRASLQAGAQDRVDAGLYARGAFGEGALEMSRVDARTGLRGRYAFGFVWLGGQGFLTSQVQGAFAIVDASAPGIEIRQDGRAVGRTDARGRLIVADLRPYEVNTLRVDLDSYPADARLDRDSVRVRPALRRGIVARFTPTRGGEAHVLDASGAPLREGAILVRAEDGARFPVAASGRVYLDGVARTTRFDAPGCALVVTPEDLVSLAPLRCAS